LFHGGNSNALKWEQMVRSPFFLQQRFLGQFFGHCEHVDRHLDSLRGFETVPSIQIVLAKLLGRHVVDLHQSTPASSPPASLPEHLIAQAN
jgi:hypothetical protein